MLTPRYPPLKFPPQPLKQQYPKRMTIAIGMLTKDGVILAADTLFTDGLTKSYGQKVSVLMLPEFSVGFAIAGSQPVAMMALDECRDGLMGIPPERGNIHSVLAVIKSVVKRTQREQVDPVPAEERNGYRFNMLIGFTKNGHKTELLATHGASVFPVDQYYCLGIGSHIGQHVIEPSYDPFMSSRSAGYLAAYAMAAAKERVDGVGGDSHIVALHNGGFSSKIVDLNIDLFERQASEFQRKSQALFLGTMNAELPDPQYLKAREDFTEYLDSARANTRGQLFKYIADRIKRLEQAG